jgi:hypothetical protein
MLVVVLIAALLQNTVSVPIPEIIDGMNLHFFVEFEPGDLGDGLPRRREPGGGR